jgi:Tfp pilus assembly protein PilN
VKQARIIRSANFAYPWSERREFYTPVQVRLLVAVSALVVMLLLALPFYLQYRTRTEQSQTIQLAAIVSSLRQRAESAEPVLARKALLDSLKGELEARVELLREVEQTDYPLGRLLLHLSEIIPDGVVFTSIDISPPEAERRTGRRPPPGTQASGAAEAVQRLFVLKLEGAARNSEALTALRRGLENSPLLQGVEQSENLLDTGFSFRITARLPGSGAQLGGGA